MARPAPAAKGNRTRTIPYAASQLAATLRMLAPVAMPIVFQNQRGNEVPRKRYWMCSSVGWRTQKGLAVVLTSSAFGRSAVSTIQ